MKTLPFLHTLHLPLFCATQQPHTVFIFMHSEVLLFLSKKYVIGLPINSTQ